jgi:Icc-related predicted phosphoesterase
MVLWAAWPHDRPECFISNDRKRPGVAYLAGGVIHMKIIAFGDIHEHADKVRGIKDISDASCLIITGDLTNRGGTEQAERVIDYIRKYHSLVYAQAGNFDGKEVESYLREQGISLHGHGFVLGDIGIFGIGGSNPTPFKTPNEYSEEEIEALILQGYQRVKDTPLKLFVSHPPPFNTKVDRVSGGGHAGSISVRRFIETYQPHVCLTGHIHEAEGEDVLGRTIIVNPGMLKGGGYAEIFEEEGTLKAVLRQITTGAFEAGR